MKGIRIHEAAEKDALIFARVLCESWKAAYADIITPTEMAKNTDAEKRAAFFETLIKSSQRNFYIAFDGTVSCGVCSISASRDSDLQNYGEIVALYTLAEYWGRGVGQLLMQRGLAELKARNFDHIMLWTFEKNTRARRFYERNGFVFDGTYKDSGFANPLQTREVRYCLQMKK